MLLSGRSRCVDCSHPVRYLTQAQRQPSFPFADRLNPAAVDVGEVSISARPDNRRFDVTTMDKLGDFIPKPQPPGRKLYHETENDGLRQSLMKMPKYGKSFGAASLRVSLPASQSVSLRERMCSADQLTDPKDHIALLVDVSCLASIARSRLMEDPAFEVSEWKP